MAPLLGASGAQVQARNALQAPVRRSSSTSWSSREGSPLLQLPSCIGPATVSSAAAIQPRMIDSSNAIVASGTSNEPVFGIVNVRQNDAEPCLDFRKVAHHPDQAVEIDVEPGREPFGIQVLGQGESHAPGAAPDAQNVVMGLQPGPDRSGYGIGRCAQYPEPVRQIRTRLVAVKLAKPPGQGLSGKHVQYRHAHHRQQKTD